MSVPSGVTGGQLWTVTEGLEASPVELAETAASGEEETSGFPPGSQILVRDELWLVRGMHRTARDGWMLEVTGVSPFVRGIDAVFFEELEKPDRIQVLDLWKTVLAADGSPNHRRGRLFLEAVIRKTFLPQTEHGLALVDGFLMDQKAYQLRPAELALSMRNPQPRPPRRQRRRRPHPERRATMHSSAACSRSGLLAEAGAASQALPRSMSSTS
ncbi:hypothetical protein [Frankia sp. Cr1]|uniref:hypothetical protein n=1 Tax=Frankia sp. Cr1 TaxID=3073931 RepID=UPI002AD547E3|nr:hypothetical protein [Frankia sp. Cr1]